MTERDFTEEIKTLLQAALRERAPNANAAFIAAAAAAVSEEVDDRLALFGRQLARLSQTADEGLTPVL